MAQNLNNKIMEIYHRLENQIAAGEKLKELRLRGGHGLRAMSRLLYADPSYLSRVEHGRKPASSWIIKEYIERAGLPDEETVEVTTLALELLYGRAPGIEPEIARPLAEVAQIVKKYRRYY